MSFLRTVIQILGTFLIISLLVGCTQAAIEPTAEHVLPIDPPKPSATHILPVDKPKPSATQLPQVIDNPWPASCYAPGTQNFQLDLSSSEIPEIILQQGTTIMVTTNLDTLNGDVSSVARLLANPGPDGISLREAIWATNEDPGEYTIIFSPSLDGSTIYTGSADDQDLPSLRGGSVIINGDIDGDLSPDITITNASTFEYPRGFKIQSSGNTIHALQMEGYYSGIDIRPVIPEASNTIYKDITISNLVIRDGSQGIHLHAGIDGRTWDSNNRWENIFVINNDLDVYMDGITFFWNNTIGDQINNVNISNNTIRIMQKSDQHSFAIQFMVGHWVGSDNNMITNITISQNIIEGNPDNGISLMSGASGASRNVIDGVSVTDNIIQYSEINWATGAGYFGIILLTGDGASDYHDPSYVPVTYPENNVIRNVDIVGNTIEGFGFNGINLGGGNLGARANIIENVNILSNNINAVIPDFDLPFQGIVINAGDGRSDHHTTENLISNIIIQNNFFFLGKIAELHYVDLRSAAISINAASSIGADRNQVRDIWISLNQINSVVPGIHLMGALENSTENVISGVSIYCNSIVKTPTYPNWELPMKGVVLVGAFKGSTLNQVEDINLFNNNVAGILNDLSVIPNVENTAVKNTVDFQILP